MMMMITHFYILVPFKTSRSPEISTAIKKKKCTQLNEKLVKPDNKSIKYVQNKRRLRPVVHYFWCVTIMVRMSDEATKTPVTFF